ncbi:LpxL/LpxP family acyltransferase, partial [Klebsiella pneumoniae]|uniref:LpxL/LpxP family acyltransferase n=1 Tax=Klebsiella pneumoniae TaxID=573 RepID=UPI004046CE99
NTSSRQGLNAELTRYTLSLMVLERKLAASKGAMDTLGNLAVVVDIADHRPQPGGELVRPPMDDLLDADDTTIARRMNEEVEVFVKPHTEQYTWI